MHEPMRRESMLSSILTHMEAEAVSDSLMSKQLASPARRGEARCKSISEIIYWEAVYRVTVESGIVLSANRGEATPTFHEPLRWEAACTELLETQPQHTRDFLRLSICSLGGCEFTVAAEEPLSTSNAHLRNSYAAMMRHGIVLALTDLRYDLERRLNCISTTPRTEHCDFTRYYLSGIDARWRLCAVDSSLESLLQAHTDALFGPSIQHATDACHVNAGTIRRLLLEAAVSSLRNCL